MELNEEQLKIRILGENLNKRVRESSKMRDNHDSYTEFMGDLNIPILS